jgi:hypothetical protein
MQPKHVVSRKRGDPRIIVMPPEHSKADTVLFDDQASIGSRRSANTSPFPCIHTYCGEPQVRPISRRRFGSSGWADRRTHPPPRWGRDRVGVMPPR